MEHNSGIVMIPKGKKRKDVEWLVPATFLYCTVRVPGLTILDTVTQRTPFLP